MPACMLWFLCIRAICILKWYNKSSYNESVMLSYMTWIIIDFLYTFYLQIIIVNSIGTELTSDKYKKTSKNLGIYVLIWSKYNYICVWFYDISSYLAVSIISRMFCLDYSPLKETETQQKQNSILQHIVIMYRIIMLFLYS